jgi:hypothetical protein
MEPFVAPFTVLVDTAESQPFTFDGLKADADKDYRPLVVRTKFQCLGRYPHSRGDYSLEGLEEFVGIERKSLEDIQGTVLGWPSKLDQEKGLDGRQERFKKELENLTKLTIGAVVIEAHRIDCCAAMPEHGKKSIAENRKLFNRITLGMQLDFRVPWYWCDGRFDAECTTYRLLARAYRKLVTENKG